jgi:hypothetical protein
MKAKMGATRARLVPHPEHAQWVTRTFEWRAYEKLSVPGIARRLTDLGVPPSGGRAWAAGSVANILRNPKYTGRVVLGRTTNTGPTRRPGQSYTYYLCLTAMHKPDDKARWPGHVRATVREDVLTAAISQFLDDSVFAPDRRAKLAELILATQAQQHDIDTASAERLGKQLKKAATTMDAIAAETGQLAGQQDPASNAIRDRLTAQFNQRHDEHNDIQARLKAIAEAAPLPDNC